jgi:DNA-binding SARP family transcriptional activator/tetratricopeptide (TPR) repeat protein
MIERPRAGDAVMVALRLTLLGGFDALLAAGESVSLPTKKAQALLAYLGLRSGQTHQRDKLAALLWGERSDAQARDGLRHVLVALRKALPDVKPPSLLADGKTLALNPAVVEVDVPTFERRVAEGTPEALEHAAELYRGDLLLGFTVSEPLFEEWLLAERERLRELALEALARLLAHQTRTGATERAIQTAVRLLGLDPLQETGHRTLMRLYVQLGRRGSALKQYQVCVAILQRELGIEPEEETKQLYQGILRRRPAREATPEPMASQVWLPVAAVRRPPATLATDIPFIGRDEEMARLGRLLTDAVSGHGQVVALVGEAGVGKSRLVAELAAEAPMVSGRVLMGRGHESEQILPFGPWVDALQTGRVLENGTWLEVLPLAVRRELGRLLPELWPRDGESAAPPDYLKLFEGMGLLLRHVADRQPTVLILEDLHWADEMSVRLLAFIGRRLQTWRLLLLVTARDEDLIDARMLQRTLDELEREPHVATVTLGPLSRSDTLDLVQALARPGRDDAAVARLSEQVWRTSGGNPFVVIEAMRAAAQEALSPGLEVLSLPERVRDIVGRQIDRLDERSRELVALASVVGREFEFGLLQHISGLGEEEVARGVEDLTRRRVLHSVGERLDFTHDRVREVAYSRILAPRRKVLHRRVAEALAALHAASLESHHLALGLHYVEGEVWDKAVVHLRRAGARAVEHSANREAVACFEQALAVLAHMPESRATLELATDLRLELRIPLQALGEVARGAECSREAERLARQLGDPCRLARASVHMCNHSRMAGRMAEAVALGQRALTVADELNDPSLMIPAAFSLALVRSYLGNYAEAEELLRRTMHAVEGNRIHDRYGLDGLPAVMAPGHLARMLAECGRFEEGVILGKKAIEVGKALDHPYSLVMACWGLGWLYNVRGVFDQAIALLEAGHAISRKWELSSWLPNNLEELGVAYACSGRLDEGVALLEESLKAYGAVGRRPLTVHLGETYLLAGRPDDACAFARATLILAQRRGERRLEAFALHLLGASACQRGPVAVHAAEGRYRQAIALAKALGMRPLVAHCHLGLGKLYRRTDKREQAREHLATATAMYREMGMTFWLEKAEAER